MRYVANGILQLPLIQRPRFPVRKTKTLVQLKIKQAVDQSLIPDRFSVSANLRCNLSVK